MKPRWGKTGRRKRCLLGEHKKWTVAIDGPAGAGKSTVARKVAERLGLLYIDTGAMYRALTWKALRRGILPAAAATAGSGGAVPGLAWNTQALVKMARESSIRLAPGPQGVRVWVDGEECTEEIRSPQVSAWVSQVAAVPEVRRLLVRQQQAMARGGGVVMDGRDIGTVVLPHADRKFYLTATVEERARRRQADLAAQGHEVSRAEVEQWIRQRDQQDSQRQEGPLALAADAILVDSTGKTVEEVVDSIVRQCREEV